MSRFLVFALISLCSPIAFANADCPEFAAPPIERAAGDVGKAIEKYEEPPFQVACQRPPGLLKDRPSQGWLGVQVPYKNAKGETTRQLLKKVAAKVKERIQGTRTLLKNMHTCMPSHAPPDCAKLKQWMTVEIPKFVKQARADLALAQSHKQWTTWAGVTSREPNTNLDDLGSYKENHWEPLTADETKEAKDALDDYDKDIKREFSERAKARKLKNGYQTDSFADKSLLAVRFKHYQSYHASLAVLPLMQYLTRAKTSKAELLTAMDELGAKLAEEEKFIASREAIVDDKFHSDGRMYDLLKYSSQLEDVLLENPSMCGLATSALYANANSELAGGLMAGLPIMAASFAAPPLAGLALGGATGGGFAYMSQLEFETANRKAISNIYGDEVDAPVGYKSTELDGLERAHDHRNYDVVALPLGMGLMSKAVKSGAQLLSLPSMQVATKVFSAKSIAP